MGGEIRSCGNEFDVGDKRKTSVKGGLLVCYVSHQQMMGPLSVLKKTEEEQVEGECWVLDMSIEMSVTLPNGRVK